jgi:hypothetical protein
MARHWRTPPCWSWASAPTPSRPPASSSASASSAERTPHRRSSRHTTPVIPRHETNTHSTTSRP